MLIYLSFEEVCSPLVSGAEIGVANGSVFSAVPGEPLILEGMASYFASVVQRPSRPLW